MIHGVHGARQLGLGLGLAKDGQGAKEEGCQGLCVGRGTEHLDVLFLLYGKAIRIPSRMDVARR